MKYGFFMLITIVSMLFVSCSSISSSESVATPALSTTIETSTPTILPTATAIPKQALIDGIIFHDLNGNGIQDLAITRKDLSGHPDGYLGAIEPIQEPAISGATITFSDYETTSDSEGNYHLSLPVGEYKLSISSNPFRFYIISTEMVHDLNYDFDISIQNNMHIDLGLGIGLLTLPYRLSEADLFRQGSFTDIDPTPGSVGVYNSYPENCNWWHCTGDAHRGIDYNAPKGTVVVAAGPGMVYSVGKADDGSLMVVVVHTKYNSLSPSFGERIRVASTDGIQTTYQHLDKAHEGIEPGVFVSRGQPIGYLNEAVHLHIDAWHMIQGDCADDTGCYVDIYRDQNHEKLEFIAHKNHSYGDYPIWISQGSPGYWTADTPYFSQE